jgi:hypothetical protein
VIMANGLPATTTALLVRNIVRLFDFFPVFYGVGLVAMFATKRTQRLGDLAGNTVVVRERNKVTLEQARASDAIVYYHIGPLQPLPSYIDVGPLDEKDKQLVVAYLQGRAQFGSNAAASRMLADRVARKMFGWQGGPGAPTTTPDGRAIPKAEMLLEYVARAIELGRGGAVDEPAPAPASRPSPKPPPQSAPETADGQDYGF